ncbi:MAG: U32 family peptidase [Firmicutes bacterium]|nr:U32 family peptidase [Bacillota bacterium]
MELKNIELLMPSGDLECVETAIRYGADAVYLGGPFMQMRAEHVGFGMEDVAEACKKLHKAEKKLYVTVNCFANNDEIPRLGDYAKELYDTGVDAIIVSDIGAIAEIKEKCPEMEIHLSTQANCMNYKAAEVYYNMGVKRIVLARELSLDRIAEIAANKPKDLELEAFIHGAMCMSYSGRCMLSAFLTGRSGNRGECAQVCRWNYYLMEEKRPGEYFPVIESERGMTILSSKELCCVGLLDKLAEAGVVSFKVEGRMRTPFYVGTVANAYRSLMDGNITKKQAREELNTVSHRPYCTGFYEGQPSQIAPDDNGYIRDALYVGNALEGGKMLTRNAFDIGDELEVLTPGKVGRAFKVEKIVNAEGEFLERSSHPMDTIEINLPEGVLPGDIIRKRV